MMRRRKRPVQHLVLDGVAAHKSPLVRDYVAATQGRVSPHFLPAYLPYFGRAMGISCQLVTARNLGHRHGCLNQPSHSDPCK
jgi:hypothetical protein